MVYNTCNLLKLTHSVKVILCPEHGYCTRHAQRKAFHKCPVEAVESIYMSSAYALKVTNVSRKLHSRHISVNYGKHG